ncbi:uncharacterized protein isoform X2 [Musca autumnalis]|uniref:uncharacterized protein isoform X2 n=1 Tax=Musca autumnalis TaxID=221902 RepID=UPI003CE8A331
MDVPELPKESIERLSKLLKSWRLEFLVEQFIDEKIDEEVLEMIDASHINLLLQKYPMGVQIRFTHNLEKWRQSIGRPLKPTTFNEFTPTLHTKEICGFSPHSQFSQGSTLPIADKVYESSEPDRSLEDNISIISNHNLEMSTWNTSSDNLSSIDSHKSMETTEKAKKEEQQQQRKIDLEEILMNSPPNGPDLIDIYRRQKQFTLLDRKRLISTIVNYYLECKLPMDLSTSYDLENAIVKLFPNERLRLYRTTKYGKIFCRYTREMKKEKECEARREQGLKEYNPADMSMYLPNESFLIDEDGEEDVESIALLNHDILIQTVYQGQKKFTKIRTPFFYNSFLTTACENFNITNVQDYCLHLNGCEIEENRFKNLILKFYKSPTFSIELKSKLNAVDQLDASSYLPDEEYIKKIPTLVPLVKIYQNGKPLENAHRTTIAKAIVDECLKLNTERVLRKSDFLILAKNICKVFPTEVQSTYYIACENSKPARGKLYYAYANKRNLLYSTGVLSKKCGGKRKISSLSDLEDNENANNNAGDGDDDDKEEVRPKRKRGCCRESKTFSIHTPLDMDTLMDKWQDCHETRRNELLERKLNAKEYMKKYSILQGERGLRLIELDVKELYPNMESIDTWLVLYEKVVAKVRSLKKNSHVQKIVEDIDASGDIRYRASLALDLLVHLFPNVGRISKPEVQTRFLKQYKTMEELLHDGSPQELQLRYVHHHKQIVYADFTACGGFVFKFHDLLDALTHCFHYIKALNLEYPQICLYLWQFVQLAIFQIDIESGQLPLIESTINDLLQVPNSTNGITSP